MVKLVLVIGLMLATSITAGQAIQLSAAIHQRFDAARLR
jgi:hypothetical protein